MSWKTGRITALAVALAGVGAMLVATASASAFILVQNNWRVSGSLTPKTLNQTVTLPEGSTFNGNSVVNAEGSSVEKAVVTGTITGTVFVPPFKATLSILGVPTTVGITFTPVGETHGTLASAPYGSCTNVRSACVTATVPTEAIIGITSAGVSAGLLGASASASTSTECQTVEPASFNLVDTLTLEEMLRKGPHFTGTVTIPPIKCSGVTGLAFGPTLTTLMSGPENPYVLAISPPS
jgi:hypothetical protein